jgi:hypothetical protein
MAPLGAIGGRRRVQSGQGNVTKASAISSTSHVVESTGSVVPYEAATTVNFSISMTTPQSLATPRSQASPTWDDRQEHRAEYQVNIMMEMSNLSQYPRASW